MAIPGWKDSSSPLWVNMILGGAKAMDNADFKSNYKKFQYLGSKTGGDYVFFDGDQYLNAAKSQNYQITNLEEHRNKIAEQTKKNETQTAINKALVERDKIWQEQVNTLKDNFNKPADLTPRIRQEQKVSGTKSKRYSAVESTDRFNSILAIKNLLGE